MATNSPSTSKKKEEKTSDMDSIQQLLKELTGTMNARLDRIEDSMENRETESKNTTKHVVLKKPGNQKQLDYNTEIHDIMEKASTTAKAGKITKAIELMQEGMVLVKKRIKLIKYADMYSWAAAAEYEGPELADNSSDEKRMRQAEAAAERKQKSRMRARGNKEARSSGRHYGNTSNQPFRRGRPADEDRRQYGRPARAGKCHECGRFGHWAAECYSRKGDNKGGR